jgi:hypothetical protein
MVSRVEVLLRGMNEAIDKVAAMYERDLHEKAVSDDLLYEVRRALSDGQDSLDWTATALDQQPYGRQKDRSPYFPLRGSADALAGAISKDFPELPSAVAAAIERHQPYQAGKTVLGYLHDLGRINKHQDFTAQTRVEALSIRPKDGGTGTFGLSGGPQIRLSGGASITMSGGASISFRGPGVPISQNIAQTVYVDWLFDHPPVPRVPVLATLRSLHSLISEAVRDIRHEANL